MNLRNSYLISLYNRNVFLQLTFKKYMSRKSTKKLDIFDADSFNNISRNNRHLNGTTKLTGTKSIEPLHTDEIILKEEPLKFYNRRSVFNLSNKFKYALTSKENFEVHPKTKVIDQSALFNAVDLDPIINQETSLQSRPVTNFKFKRTNETEFTETHDENERVRQNNRNKTNYFPFKHNSNTGIKTLRSVISTIKRETWIPDNKKKKLPIIQGEILFGVNPVLLALQEKRRTFYTLYLKKSLSESRHLQKVRELATELDIPQVETDLLTLDALTQNHSHQGFCLDVSKMNSLPLPEESGIIDDHLPLWLVMDKIQDPMNFGAVIRSAYYLGVDRVIISEKRSCSLSPVVSKASSGVLELLPIFHVKNLIYFLQDQQEHGWEIIGSFVNSVQTDIKTIQTEEFSITKPTILILGNENKGVSSALLKLCNYSLMVDPYRPLHPGVDSLNVSVAAGILLFNLSRSRQKQSKFKISLESNI